MKTRCMLLKIAFTSWLISLLLVGAHTHKEEDFLGIESAWTKAFMATGIISIIPTLILPMIPLTTSKNGVVSLNHGLHSFLLSFAAGGLLGEVFLHSIPHLLEHHDHFSHDASAPSPSHDEHDEEDEHKHYAEGEEEEQEEGEEHNHDDHHHEHDEHHHHEHADTSSSGSEKINQKELSTTSSSSSHSHDQQRHAHGEVFAVSLWVLGGFLLFFISEKIVKLVLGDHGHDHSSHHHHHHAEKKVVPTENGEGTGAINRNDEEGEGEEEEPAANGLRRRTRRSERLKSSCPASSSFVEGCSNRISTSNKKGSSKKKASSDDKSSAAEVAQSSSSGGGLKASGYLNITIDALHNLTDGIAIGAAFASGKGFGLATTLSVFLHEIPHEIGDFAILVQSGLSLRNAFLMQFATAIAAFIGAFVGLVSKRHEGLERILVALTTGGFLYVATVSVLPELLAGKAKLGQSIAEILGVVGGIGLMAWVALAE